MHAEHPLRFFVDGCYGIRYGSSMDTTQTAPAHACTPAGHCTTPIAACTPIGVQDCGGDGYDLDLRNCPVCGTTRSRCLDNAHAVIELWRVDARDIVDVWAEDEQAAQKIATDIEAVCPTMHAAAVRVWGGEAPQWRVFAGSLAHANEIDTAAYRREDAGARLVEAWDLVQAGTPCRHGCDGGWHCSHPGQAAEIVRDAVGGGL